MPFPCRLMEGMRVMGDEICYPAKDCRCFIYSSHLLKFDLVYFSIILRHQNVTCHVSLGIVDLSIHKLFSTRADLHRTVYTHAKVKVWMIILRYLLFLTTLCFIYYEIKKHVYIILQHQGKKLWISPAWIQVRSWLVHDWFKAFLSIPTVRPI